MGGFFLEGVHETAKGAVRTANNLAYLFEHALRLVSGTGKAIQSSLRVAFEALRARPILNLSELAEALSLSFPTASKAIEKLSALGIARELAGQRRKRLFVYSAYLNPVTNEKNLLLNLCVLGVNGGQIQAAPVEAEGRAPGNMKTAHEQALADALR